MDLSNIKVARVATVPFSLLGSRNILEHLANRFNLYVICSKGRYLDDIQSSIKRPIICISIKRSISVFSDLKSVLNLYLYLKKERFHIVHSNTPKGGLICAISSFLARVPIRCHTFTGQRWATMHGYKRLLLKACDKIIFLLNNNLYADSQSQIEFLANNGIVDKDRVTCIGYGGFAGIDFNRFDREKLLSRSTPPWLSSLQGTLKIGFLGRVVREKGIVELISSLERLWAKGMKISLVLIGPFEPELDPLPPRFVELIQNSPMIYHTGYQSHPEKFLVHVDLLCLPSYREGFPMAILESGALKVPSVSSRIVGSVDTIEENTTGLFFDLEDPHSLDLALEKVYKDRKFLINLGENAYKRVKLYHSEEYLQREFELEYIRLLEQQLEENL